MNSLAQTLWENNQLFGDKDGIVYLDKIIELDYVFSSENENLCKSIIIGKTTIEEELSSYPEPYRKALPNGTFEYRPDPNNILEIGVEIQIHPLSPITYENNYIYFGEGSMGNEGFVAFIGDDNQYIWSIFFVSTNPIKSARIEENFLYLLSTNLTKVKINLKNPTEVEILYSNNC